MYPSVDPPSAPVDREQVPRPGCSRSTRDRPLPPHVESSFDNVKQLPPKNSKNTDRVVVLPAILTEQSWGKLRSGVQGSVMQNVRKHSATVSLQPTLESRCSIQSLPREQYAKVSLTQSPPKKKPGRRAPRTCPRFKPRSRQRPSHNTPRCHSPNPLRRRSRGGGHLEHARVPLPTKNTRHRTKATTTPLPERQRYNPFRRSDRGTVRVIARYAPCPATKPPSTRASRPSFQVVERSLLLYKMRTGTTV
jgi:hypothetical protein